MTTFKEVFPDTKNKVVGMMALIIVLFIIGGPAYVIIQSIVTP